MFDLKPAAAESRSSQAVQQSLRFSQEKTVANPVSKNQPASLANSILNLQRRVGNRYIQSAIKLVRQADGDEVAPDVEETIQHARGGGQAMDRDLQVQMENAFGSVAGGVDFSQVRVHTDAKADDLNQAVSARAFTTGQDIFFRQGEYNPGSSAGRELLAHELTHVIQQSDEARPKLTVSQPDDEYEQEADQMAQQVVQRIQLKDEGGVVSNRSLDRNIWRSCEECDETVQRQPAQIQRSPGSLDWRAFRIHGSSSFITATLADLRRIEATSSGSALISALESYSDPWYRSRIRIEERSWCGLSGNLGNIGYNPSSCGSSLGSGPWQSVPNYVYLYHELVHAYLYFIAGKGTHRDRECMATGLGPYFVSEPYSENKLRCELGLPIRPFYADPACTGMAAPTCAPAASGGTTTPSTAGGVGRTLQRQPDLERQRSEPGRGAANPQSRFADVRINLITPPARIDQSKGIDDITRDFYHIPVELLPPNTTVPAGPILTIGRYGCAIRRDGLTQDDFQLSYIFHDRDVRHAGREFSLLPGHETVECWASRVSFTLELRQTIFLPNDLAIHPCKQGLDPVQERRQILDHERLHEADNRRAAEEVHRKLRGDLALTLGIGYAMPYVRITDDPLAFAAECAQRIRAGLDRLREDNYFEYHRLTAEYASLIDPHDRELHELRLRMLARARGRSAPESGRVDRTIQRRPTSFAGHNESMFNSGRNAGQARDFAISGRQFDSAEEGRVQPKRDHGLVYRQHQETSQEEMLLQGWAAGSTTDENLLTNKLFFHRHPDLNPKKSLRPGTPEAIEWMEIRNTIVRPYLSPKPRRQQASPLRTSAGAVSSDDWLAQAVRIVQHAHGLVNIQVENGLLQFERTLQEINQTLAAYIAESPPTVQSAAPSTQPASTSTPAVSSSHIQQAAKIQNALEAGKEIEKKLRKDHPGYGKGQWMEVNDDSKGERLDQKLEKKELSEGQYMIVSGSRNKATLKYKIWVDGFEGYGAKTDQYVCTTFVAAALEKAGFAITKETRSQINIHLAELTEIEEKAKSEKKSGKEIVKMKREELKRLLQTGDERMKGMAMALVKSGQGVEIPEQDFDKLQPGDLMQYWTTTGGGHAVIIEHVEQKGTKLMVRFLGSNPWTHGIGYHTMPLLVNGKRSPALSAAFCVRPINDGLQVGPATKE